MIEERSAIQYLSSHIHETPSNPRQGIPMTFFVLCAGEAGLLLLFLSLYRAATKPDAWGFLFSLPGIVCLGSLIVVVSTIMWTIHTFRKSDRSGRKRELMALGMNVLMLIMTVPSLEGLTRLLSKDTAEGEAVLGIPLRPKQWSAFTQAEKTVEKLTRKSSYLIHDPILGWTVGPSRGSETSVEISSAEGLRSPHVGMSFMDPETRHGGSSQRPASVRVALIGDSMTFSYEVRCEESWAHVLEGYLQPDTQVLNFGVSAYGLNQVFLRYEKDVRLWRPQIVVIGISSEMIRRVNSLYPVLMNPEWTGFPFVRPRLVLKDETLSTINHPVPKPEDLADYATIKDLPYLELDDYFHPSEWKRGGMWWLLEHSYFFRFFNSLRPPSEADFDDKLQHGVQSSQLVLQHLIRKVRGEGSIPLLVYFPYKWELSLPGESAEGENSLSVRVLRSTGIKYYDMTACLMDAGDSAAYTEGGHYSPRGNAHVARCLEPVLQAELGKVKREHIRPVKGSERSDAQLPR